MLLLKALLAPLFCKTNLLSDQAWFHQWSESSNFPNLTRIVFEWCFICTWNKFLHLWTAIYHWHLKITVFNLTSLMWTVYTSNFEEGQMQAKIQCNINTPEFEIILVTLTGQTMSGWPLSISVCILYFCPPQYLQFFARVIYQINHETLIRESKLNFPESVCCPLHCVYKFVRLQRLQNENVPRKELARRHRCARWPISTLGSRIFL